MIDWKMACRLRFLRGLKLFAVEGKYSDPRLFELVKELEKLETRISEIDSELLSHLEPEDQYSVADGSGLTL